MLEDKNISGIILVYKPKGISSFTVVNIVRKTLGVKKAGHLGTLDLAGEGLLPIALNKATSLFDYYLTKDKVYQTTFEFGWTTDTLDLEGKEVKRNDKTVTKDDILKVIPSLTGKIAQMPPEFSAKKVNGMRAYDIARAGGQVLLKPKEIEIYSIKLLREQKQNTFDFEIHCSSGTYIRSIARDMAEKLSTYGVMRCILRTKCGNFHLKDASTLEEIKQGNFNIIKAQDLFDLPLLKLDKMQTEKLLNGVWIEINVEDGEYKAFCEERFLGVVEIKNKITKFKHRFI